MKIQLIIIFKTGFAELRMQCIEIYIVLNTIIVFHFSCYFSNFMWMIYTLSVHLLIIICKVVWSNCFNTECMCLVFSSVSEEAIRSAESRLRQRFPRRSFRLHQSGSDPAGALPLQPGQEAPRGAGGRGEGGSEEGVSAGAVSLAAHHRDAGRPTQPQNQHRHQLVPQLQVRVFWCWPRKDTQKRCPTRVLCPNCC